MCFQVLLSDSYLLKTMGTVRRGIINCGNFHLFYLSFSICSEADCDLYICCKIVNNHIIKILVIHHTVTILHL